MITKQQINVYLKIQKLGSGVQVAAAKAGFSRRSAYNLKERNMQSLKGKKRNYRTRKNPYETVWKSDIIPLLEENPTLKTSTIYEELCDRYPDESSAWKKRTLERHVREWKDKYGPEKELIFRQKVPPAEQALSDFTCMNALNIQINGKPFKHLLYHYRLRYSGWSYAAIVEGGESFEALSFHLQKALELSLGSPKTHRTDSLSAAFKNIEKEDQKDLTDSYESLCKHYRMKPTRNNKGVSHENGAIESAHGHLKSAIDQKLLLRGSRDFASLENYQSFIESIMTKRNSRVQERFLEERKLLRPLPEERHLSYSLEQATVSSSSTMSVKSVLYSVPSRYSGKQLTIHLYKDHLECFFKNELVMRTERLRRKKGVSVKSINYRHIIGHLQRKPGAFWHYVHQEECFPNNRFKEAWLLIKAHLEQKEACKEFVQLLKIASEGNNEFELSEKLGEALTKNDVAAITDLKEEYIPSNSEDLDLPYEDLREFNSLLEKEEIA